MEPQIKAQEKPLAYKLIKKYPGSAEINSIISVNLIPGHQWPEYYRPVYQEEYELILRLNSLKDQIYKLEKEILTFD